MGCHSKGSRARTDTDGDTKVQVAQGTPKTYFVVPTLTLNAATQTPNQFRITHVTESSSTAEDRDHDIALTLEYAVNVASATTTATLADTDGDGLRDYDEVMGTYGYVTDPNNADPDDDGLSDYDEVMGTYGYVTDPNNADSDNDGFSDGEEIDGGTNPNDDTSYPGAWVDFAFTGAETGSWSQPFNTLAEGSSAIASGQIIKIKGNTGDSDTAETPRITKSMRIDAVGGPVRIGAP